MRIIRKLRVIVLGAILLTAIPVSSVSAAGGNAAFTAESNASVTTGTPISVSLYVTASGSNIYNGQVTVDLTNLTYQSYAASSNFPGANQIVTSSATSFTILFSHTGASSGSSGKVLIGTASILASGAGGTTGTLDLKGEKGDDAPGDPMTHSAADRNITINAAATTPPPSSGGTTPSTPGSTPVKSIDSPNPDSTGALPGGNEDGTANIVSENDISLATSGLATDSEQETIATTTKKSSIGLVVKLAIGLGLIVLAAVAAKLMLGRMAHARELNRHVVGGSTGFVGSSDATTPSQPQEPPKDDNTPPSGPTIITPGQ